MNQTGQLREAGLVVARILFLGLAICSVGGCLHRTALLEPPIGTPAPFSDSGDQPAPDLWWTAFREPELNDLVAEALESDLTLKAAWERFQEASAVARRESASLFPEVEGYADARVSDGGGGDGDGGGGGRGGRGDGGDSGTDGDGNRGDGGSFGGGGDGEEYELGLTASYEVDLWGRIQASVEAERLRAVATLADYHAMQLSVSAEVTRTWVQLMEACARRDLLASQVEANEKLLTQLKNQFAGGVSRSVDVLRQQQLLAATRQELHATVTRIEVLEHQLAVLSGEPAQNGVKYTAKGFPALPPLPATGLPVELVQRRPDVRNAFNQLRAADREVAAAISDQFPRLTISAEVYSAAGGAEQLFEDWTRSFAANLIAPLIDGGRRRAEVYRTAAVERQRLYEYGQAILVAFQEVEDALIQEKQLLAQIRELEEQVRLAEDTYGQLLVEYANGVSNFIDLLTALTEEQELRRDLLEARRMLLENRIDLYRALAGGFEPNGT